MTESLCNNCKNWFVYKIKDNVNDFGNECIFKNGVFPDIIECSHYKQKNSVKSPFRDSQDGVHLTGKEPRNKVDTER